MSSFLKIYKFSTFHKTLDYCEDSFWISSCIHAVVLLSTSGASAPKEEVASETPTGYAYNLNQACPGQLFDKMKAHSPADKKRSENDNFKGSIGVFVIVRLWLFLRPLKRGNRSLRFIFVRRAPCTKKWQRSRANIAVPPIIEKG